MKYESATTTLSPLTHPLLQLVEGVLGRLQGQGALREGLVVRLSGLLHTDDLQALKVITRQLRLEEAAAKKVFRSFAGE